MVLCIIIIIIIIIYDLASLKFIVIETFLIATLSSSLVKQ